MAQTILIIAGIMVAVLLLSRYAREQVEKRAKEAIGICEYALDQTVHKRGNKEKIIALLEERGEAHNAEIRELLEISRRSAARYMTELEQEGRVEQIGDVGRGVTYRLSRKE